MIKVKADNISHNRPSAPATKQWHRVVMNPLFLLCLSVIFTGCSKKQPVGLIVNKDGTAAHSENDTLNVGTDSLEVNADSIYFGYEDSIKQFYVVNVNEDFLEWELKTDQSWVTVDPTYGAIAKWDSTKITVRISRSGLDDGTFQGSILVAAGNKSHSVSLTAQVFHDIVKRFDFTVSDAEFSRQLNKIVMIDSLSNMMHIHDPEANTDMEVSLPLKPNCVSVGPDGMHAVVGHNGFISYISLTTGQLISTYNTSHNIYDIILAGNGYVYPCSRNLYSIKLSDGVETAINWTSGTSIARLHPSGSAIYSSTPWIPCEFEKISISGGIAQFLYSVRPLAYDIGGNLWISEDGTKIFTKEGNVFSSSTIQAQDMLYYGYLSDSHNSDYHIGSLANSSANGKVFITTKNYYPYWMLPPDTLVKIYDGASFNLENSVVLPNFRIDSNFYGSQGDHVFLRNDGMRYYVIVSACSVSVFTYETITKGYGIVSYKYPENTAIK